MALTIADLGEQSSGRYDGPVTKRFGQTSDILKWMPVKKIDSGEDKYRVQDTLSGVQNRAINEGYIESTGRIGSRTEGLAIFGGQFFSDRAIPRLSQKGGDGINLIAEQAMMKSTALAREIERQVIKGDKLYDPKQMEGLRRRCTGNQVIAPSSGGTTMTLAMVDQLIDAVAKVGEMHFICGKSTRRKWTNLALASATVQRVQISSINGFGTVIESYDGIPITVVEDPWDASSFMDAEDPGDGTADTYSIYLVAAGEEEGVCMLVNGDGPLVDCYQVTKETEQGPPGELWRLETYIGMRVKNPRAIGRLRALLVA